MSPSLKAYTDCKLHGLLSNRLFKIFQTVILGKFNSKLAGSVDFRGLRTKFCRSFSIVSSATYDRPWPGSLWDTQPFSTNLFYHAKKKSHSSWWIFVILGHELSLHGNGWLRFIKKKNTVRAPHQYTTPWWLVRFLSSSARVECHLVVWIKTRGLGTTFEAYVIKLLLLVQKIWQQIFV